MAAVVPSDSVAHAAEKMKLAHVGSVIVTEDGGRPIGILTDRDIVCRVVAEAKDPAKTLVRAVMSTGLAVARIDDLIEEAALQMRQKGVRRLPIVGSDGKVMGIVSLDDLLVLFAAELAQTASVARSNKGP